MNFFEEDTIQPTDGFMVSFGNMSFISPPISQDQPMLFISIFTKLTS
jgi:hypothetical protein